VTTPALKQKVLILPAIGYEYAFATTLAFFLLRKPRYLTPGLPVINPFLQGITGSSQSFLFTSTT
jgi:hypothetical protein